MNVYDFDGTIFPGDCSIGFCFWCMNRHPKLWFTFHHHGVADDLYVTHPGVTVDGIMTKLGL